MGFWFGHPQDAVKILGINPKSFRKWQKDGTLGAVAHLSKDSVKSVPQYLAGFWFDTLDRASEKLNQKINTLKKRVKTGFVEQKSNKSSAGKLNNPMRGKTGFQHHNSKPVIVEGVLYGSLRQAALNTRYTQKMIHNRIKNQVPRFSFGELNNV